MRGSTKGECDESKTMNDGVYTYTYTALANPSYDIKFMNDTH
jgi:hypothetical protein